MPLKLAPPITTAKIAGDLTVKDQGGKRPPACVYGVADRSTALSSGGLDVIEATGPSSRPSQSVFS
jgi:hypothetical protein